MTRRLLAAGSLIALGALLAIAATRPAPGARADEPAAAAPTVFLLGPVGAAAPAGSPFEMAPPGALSKVQIRRNVSRITGVRCWWRAAPKADGTPAKPIDSGVYGTGVGNTTHDLVLAEGETIVRVYGKSNAHLAQIAFETSEGRTEGPWGISTPGDHPFDFHIPPGYVLGGFWGRTHQEGVGRAIDQLGVVVVSAGTGAAPAASPSPSSTANPFVIQTGVPEKPPLGWFRAPDLRGTTWQYPDGKRAVTNLIVAVDKAGKWDATLWTKERGADKSTGGYFRFIVESTDATHPPRAFLYMYKHALDPQTATPPLLVFVVDPVSGALTHEGTSFAMERAR